MNKLRTALVVSHPIQHFCPQYASFAKHRGIVLKVFFASALGYKPYHDPNFNTTISWNRLGLEHFEHQFLNNGQVLQADKDLDAPEIEEALQQFHPDVVIIYGYFQKLQRRVYSWARKNKVTIVYISDSELRQKRNKLKELAKYPLLRRFFFGIDYALTVGDANEEYYRYVGLKKDQMVRMHFPIDIALYKKAFEERDELRAKIRQQYNIADNEFVISVAGKLVHWKNQSHIIQAMKLLEEQGVYTQAFILGSGEMMNEWKKEAEQLTKSKVHFTGFVSADELPGYYAASDVYIHPAAAEPHSLAISEAIYMGRPVIISDRCGSYGPTDDVQEGKNGFVYPFGDIASLADKIKFMMNETERIGSFREYSHKLAVDFQETAHGGVLDALISKLKKDVVA